MRERVIYIIEAIIEDKNMIENAVNVPNNVVNVFVKMFARFFIIDF